MPNNIAFARNYTAVIDEVYQRASISVVLNSGRRMVRAGHNAKEILIPHLARSGLPIIPNKNRSDTSPCLTCAFAGRGDWIRTSDPLLPKARFVRPNIAVYLRKR